MTATFAARIAGLHGAPVTALGASRPADVIDLSVGAPGFDTAIAIADAAIRAIRDGDTRYTRVDGVPALKDAICDALERDGGLRYSPQEISVGAGGKQVIFNAFCATIDPGDEVVIPAPSYPTYAEITRLFDGRPVLVATDASAGFKITAQDVERHLTPRTRWLVLNSPGNPSGCVYTAGELRAIADAVRSHEQVRILSDEIYNRIVFDPGGASGFAAVAPDLKRRTLTINGVSKTYAMTGWRIGYGASDEELVRAMAMVQSQTTTCPSSVSQAAATAALRLDPEVHERLEVLRGRRRTMLDWIAQTPGVECVSPAGGIYVFPDFAAVLAGPGARSNEVTSGRQLASFLLEHAGVASAAGASYHAPSHLRLTFAVDDEALAEGCARLTRGLSLLAESDAAT